MEMESRLLAVMFIVLDVDLTSIGCCHSTLRQWVSILVVWYVSQTNFFYIFTTVGSYFSSMVC